MFSCMKLNARNSSIYLLLLFTASWFSFSSCSIARRLDEGQHLLKRNKLTIVDDGQQQNFTSSDLKRYYRQKPNKKFLRVIPFHAMAYNFGESINIPDTTGFSGFRKWGWKRKNNFRNWVMRNGEPPVALDTIAADRTLVQFESFLFTKGHFTAEAERDISYRNRKAVVRYSVYPGPGHRISQIFVDIPSEEIRKQYEYSAGNILLKPGAPYDERVIQNERDRITRILKDSGFFHFNKAYILAEADTFLPGNELDLYLNIQDQSFFAGELRDSVVTLPHQRSRINRIYINPEYEGIFVEKTYMTIPVEVERQKGDGLSTYFFLTTGKPAFNPQMLIRNILLEPGQWYSLRDVELTYLYLSDLGNFTNISITFTDSPEPPVDGDTTISWIDCVINMTRMPRQSYEIRMDVTNRAGDPGLSSNLVYQNRNLFRGAEVMSLALKGALEVQKILDKDQVETTIFDRLPFNTVELGAELDVRIPKFVAPFSLSGLPKTFKPRTRFSGGVNFQERPDYKRYLIKVTSGYQWQMNQNIAMAVNPFEANAVSIFPTPSFVEKIEALNDPRLRNSYSDHIITAMSASLVFDNQGARIRPRYSFLRLNMESSGLLLNSGRNVLNYSVNSDGIAMVFNIPYAQYLRADVDFRQFFRLPQKDHVIAGRVYLGLGIPYGNMDVLPFEKSFYAGGANGIRAWTVRTLGPGSYHDDSELFRFDRTGDIGLETSLEYRFPVYGSVHGAMFFDGGNVWLKNPNEKYPGGELSSKDFLSEIALGTGFGIRIVSFFVIRVDAGVKLHDPAKPKGDKWVIDKMSFKGINWNLGIGYSI